MCVFVFVLGEVSPSLLCLYIKKNEICSLYGLAAGKKNLAHEYFAWIHHLKYLKARLF